MLLSRLFFGLTIPSLLFGLEPPSIELYVEYFNLRNLKFICLLNCGDSRWSVQFSKMASGNHLSVANVPIDKIFTNYDKIRKCFNKNLTSIGIVMDIKCRASEDILDYASQNAWFDSTHSWLIIDDNNIAVVNQTDGNFEPNVKSDRDDNSLAVQSLEDLNIGIDADITLALGNGISGYNLYDVFNFGKVQGGHLIVNDAGTWIPGHGLKFSSDGYKYYRRWDFGKLPLRMISVASVPADSLDPTTLFEVTPSRGVSIITKTASIILNVVAELHNFRFVHTFTDRWIGPFGANESKAVSNALYMKEQDVSPVIRYLKSVSEKNDMVHPPVTSIETRYYYRIPSRGAGKFENQFLRPLSTGAWACVVAVAALCAVMLMVSAKFEQRPTSIQYAVFSVFASICQQFFQDYDDVGSRVSTARKVTVLVTGVSCVLIYNYYTSSVVSWLLNGPPPSINTLRELLESPLDLIYEDIGYTRSWLQIPNYYYNRRNMLIEDDLRKKKVLNKKKGDPLLVSLDEGIAMVKAGGMSVLEVKWTHQIISIAIQRGNAMFPGYAYHTEVDSANRLISRTFTQNELCELGSLQSMEATMLYICVQKNSPYKEFFVWNLMRLYERGIMSCIQKRTKSPSVACEGSSPRALDLGGASPAFILLAAGYLLATVIVLLERKYRIKAHQERCETMLDRPRASDVIVLEASNGNSLL